jgi:3-isopropylmalate dehydratase small subunit
MGEVTISTGNRNFPGKQGKGSVYLASPEVVAASAVAGCIVTADNIPDQPLLFPVQESSAAKRIKANPTENSHTKSSVIEGRIWIIDKDNIDTDMIYHNRYLAITDVKEMGQYTFDNLKGFEDFSKNAKQGDIVITGKNFGCGSSRQQAVDCFNALGIQAIIAESFGAIYERNAINAAFPILICKEIGGAELKNGDMIRVDFITGRVENLRNNTVYNAVPFSDVQYEVYQKGGLLGK